MGACSVARHMTASQVKGHGGLRNGIAVLNQHPQAQSACQILLHWHVVLAESALH